MEKQVIVKLNSYLVVISALLASTSVRASADLENDEWQFSVLFPMIWVSDIKGDIDVGDNSFTVNKSFQDTLDTLSFGYMAEIYAKKGRWSYGFKFNYEESDNKYITDEYSSPRGITLAPSHEVKTEAERGTTDLIVGYQLKNELMLFTGVRYIFSDRDLEVTPLGTGLIEVEEKITVVNEDLFDWLIGAEYNYKINNNWNFVVNADFAIAGDNDTDYAVNTTLTYRINKLNTFWAGYRYFRVKDKFVEDGVAIKTDFATQGPTLGWAFNF